MEKHGVPIQETPVLILGAGPAGLAVAAHLRKREIDFLILEAGEAVGNAWHKHYKRVHLHTVKERSHLPFLPFPDYYPQYVPRAQFVEYLIEYTRHFQISPLLGRKVVRLEKQDDSGKWEATDQFGYRYLAGAVVVATGVNRIPNRPVWEGEALFQGSIIHSNVYTEGQAFKGKKVLVVGMGNTGAEIALDLFEQGAEPWISVRGPVNIVPRDFLGRPTQLTALKVAKLPNWLGDRIGLLLRAIAVGDLSRFGIKAPATPPAAQLRETGQTPVVDIGTVRLIKAGKIKVLPGIQRLNPDGATFTDGRSLPFDTIVLATGYHAGLAEFIPDCASFLDTYGLPTSWNGSGLLNGLFFIGFDNYTAGGVLGVINRDSEKIATKIAMRE